MLEKINDAFAEQGIALWAFAALILLGAALIAPGLNPYYVRVITMALMCGYLAASWNLIGGYAGQMSLGHALFFGLGSYTTALVSAVPGAALIWAFPLAIILSALLAWIIATICFRYALRGIYFAVGTLLLAEITRIIVTNSATLGRSQGLQVMAPPGIAQMNFGSNLPFLYAFSVMVVLIALGALVLERSKVGYQLIALREQEESATALGVNTRKVKSMAFVASAALTSIAGVLYAGMIRFVEPGYDLSLTITLVMVMGAVLGGRGTALGPIIGGILVVLLQEILVVVGSFFGSTSVSTLAQMFYGLFFVVILLFFPRGIIGQLLHNRLERKAVISASESTLTPVEGALR